MFRCTRVLAGLVGIGLLAAVGACQISGAPARPQAAVTHEVTYLVQGDGRVSFDVAVGYTAANGSTGSDSTSGPSPLWSKTVTMDSSVTAVSLSATASGGSLQSTVRCNIVVDGVQVANRSSQFACQADVDFAELPALRSAQPPAPTPTRLITPAAPPAPPPAPAAGCSYVTDAEMLAAVQDNFSAMNPSVTSRGDATSCTYGVGGDYGSDGYVMLAWAKGAKVDAVTKREWLPVGGLGVPAYANAAGGVKIQRSTGVLTLTIFGYRSWENYLATVVAIYKAAAPRLP